MSEFESLVDKLCVMLEMQDAMNRHIDEDWLARDRAWYRAIWIECAELMDHYGGWKWWKHSEPDVEQVLLEIVDIWHFGLSLSIDEARDYRGAAVRLAAHWQAAPEPLDFLEEVERLARTALEDHAFAAGSTRCLLEDIGRNFGDLYRSYVGKNVLNVFRQDHGYRSGQYLKQWNGREDNEVLAETVAALDSEAPDFRETLYDALEAAYPGTPA